LLNNRTPEIKRSSMVDPISILGNFVFGH